MLSFLSIETGHEVLVKLTKLSIFLQKSEFTGNLSFSVKDIVFSMFFRLFWTAGEEVFSTLVSSKHLSLELESRQERCSMFKNLDCILEREKSVHFQKLAKILHRGRERQAR